MSLKNISFTNGRPAKLFIYSFLHKKLKNWKSQKKIFKYQKDLFEIFRHKKYLFIFRERKKKNACALKQGCHESLNVKIFVLDF